MAAWEPLGLKIIPCDIKHQLCIRSALLTCVSSVRLVQVGKMLNTNKKTLFVKSKQVRKMDITGKKIVLKM